MYTIKQLSDLAGITRRTLHYYDEIGLLAPTEISGNGYRWYSEQELLRLQQILLYREAGVSLGKIKQILNNPSFDKVLALKEHMEVLQKQRTRLEGLITTVEHTINYLQGAGNMSPKELFKAFNEQEEKIYEDEAMQMYDPETVKASYTRWRSYSKAEKQRIGEEGNAVYDALVLAMPHGPASPEAQAGVDRWRKHMAYFWVPNEEQLVGLTDLYNEDPRFKANFDRIHPGLASFMREAVKIYVEKSKK
jgi:DNA-binding transcriptional MerR regulator